MEELISVNSQEAAAPETNEATPSMQQDAGTQQTGQAESSDGTAQDSTAQLRENTNQRNLERDAAFAHLRRKMEAARREAQQLRSSSARGAADRQAAQWEAMRQENNFLRGQVYDRFFSDDLETIRSVYPDCQASSVDELGLNFCALRAMGVDPLVAYEAMQSAHDAQLKQKPPTTGSAKSTGKAENGFYSREDVRRMSQAEVSRNFDKIRKSMSKWR